MIQSYKNHAPSVHPSARVAENATLVGDVVLEQDVSVWYGAVIRGDTSTIHVGAGTNIQDNCVLHSDVGKSLSVGENCVVGHGAILHSCTVGNNCLVGMGAILLNNCVIGEGCLVGAGALVTEGKVFPPHTLLMGSPARAVRTLTPEEVQTIQEEAVMYQGFAKDQLNTAE